MIQIKRDHYLQQLIDGRENGLIKIVTGIRRCGKSYLLFRLFYAHLIGEGVPEDHFLRIALLGFRQQEETHTRKIAT